METAQSVKCLPSKPEDLSLNPQNPREWLSMVPVTSASNKRLAEKGGSLETTGQLPQLNGSASGLVRDPVSKTREILSSKVKSRRHLILTWDLHTLAHVCACSQA